MEHVLSLQSLDAYAGFDASEGYTGTCGTHTCAMDTRGCSTNGCTGNTTGCSTSGCTTPAGLTSSCG